MTENHLLSSPRARASWRKPAALVGIGAVVAVSLAVMGRVWWCEAGDWWPWSWDTWSRHNSQHLIDPYTLSHIQHGIGLYLLLTLFLEKRTTRFGRTLIVAIVEAAWEIVENTDWMIRRYREATISLDYFGDSILNSLADYGWCLAGVWLTMRLPMWASGLLFAALELASLAWIRDSLMLNILMLLWPLDSVRQWQISG